MHFVELLFVLSCSYCFQKKTEITILVCFFSEKNKVSLIFYCSVLIAVSRNVV